MIANFARRAVVGIYCLAITVSAAWGQAVDRGGTHPADDVPLDPPVLVKEPLPREKLGGAGSASGGGPRATFRGATPGQTPGPSMNPPQNMARPLDDQSPAHRGLQALPSGEAIGQRDRTAGPAFAAPSSRADVPKSPVDRSGAVECYRRRVQSTRSMPSPLTPAEMGTPKIDRDTAARRTAQQCAVDDRRTADDRRAVEARRPIGSVDRPAPLAPRLPARVPLRQDTTGVDHLATAVRAFQAGRYRDAVLETQRQVANNPDRSDALLLLSQSQFAAGQYDAAADALLMALSRSEPEVWGTVVMDYQQYYTDAGSYTNQLRALERAVQQRPADEARLRLLLGYQYGFLGHGKHAVSQLDRALDKDPRLPQEVVRLRDLFALREGMPAREAIE